METPDIKPTNIDIASEIVQKYQDERRVTIDDTTYLSDVQQDLANLKRFYEKRN